MAYLKIHQEKITGPMGQSLVALCPFDAITFTGGVLTIGAGCRMCKACVKNGPEGAITLVEEAVPLIDKDHWRGIAVYGDCSPGEIHPVTLELLGKARELAEVTKQPVLALAIGHGLREQAEDMIRHGADKVYCYDHPALKDFMMEAYTNLFADFIDKVKPSSVLVGATNIGRSLAPRVAARFRTGLTADCTRLEMKENTDIVQIRPAFGGNIMAQIITPNHRPQFSTVRYKIFSQPEPDYKRAGEIIPVPFRENLLRTTATLMDIQEKPKEIDISEAKIVVAVGRGVGKEQLALAKELAALLDGQMACTRPLAEDKIFDPKRQIGLSGRTVSADLIITLGISGAVQFTAGMRGSQCIIAVNKDENAPIFDVAHYGFVGDVAQILPGLLKLGAKGEGV